MTKITVYRYDDEMNSRVEAEGWFTPRRRRERCLKPIAMTAARHAQAMRRASQREESKRRCTTPARDAGFSRPLGISMNAGGSLTMNRMSTPILRVALAISS